MFIENGFNVCVFCLGRVKLYKVMVHRLLFILSSIFLINNLLLISFLCTYPPAWLEGRKTFSFGPVMKKPFDLPNISRPCNCKCQIKNQQELSMGERKEFSKHPLEL